MGLDVYLKKCVNFAEAKAREAEMTAFEDALWQEVGGWDKATEEQKELIRAKTKVRQVELNLGEYGEANEIEGIELDSQIHPTHMFKVGYLRSSYNSGGINSVLERIGVPSLYDIFEPGDEYNFTPNWLQAQARAQVAVDKLREFMATEMAQYDVIEVNGYDPVATKEEALALLKQELSRKSSFSGGYSNRTGDWFLGDGLQIVGAVPSKGGFMGQPGYFLFTKSDKPGGDYEWYLQALEVTKEMIDHVVNSDDMSNYYLAWSG